MGEGIGERPTQPVLLLILMAGQSGSNPGLQALWEDERQRRLERQLPCELEPPPSPG